MTKTEIWKPIPGYLNYKVSNFGRVKSISHKTADGRRVKGHVLNPAIRDNGYAVVNLGRGNHCRVHQLVMAAFVGDCPDGCEIDHINHNRADNWLSNLRYLDRGENRTRHRWKSVVHDGIIYPTVKAAAEATGINRETIRHRANKGLYGWGCL